MQGHLLGQLSYKVKLDMFLAPTVFSVISRLNINIKCALVLVISVYCALLMVINLISFRFFTCSVAVFFFFFQWLGPMRFI